jgi:hypothetical protein
MIASHEAIKAVRDGHRIARAGWNGKGMFVYRYDVEGFKPALVIKTASGAHQLGWVFSQDDLFADDWEIVQ